MMRLSQFSAPAGKSRQSSMTDSIVNGVMGFYFFWIFLFPRPVKSASILGTISCPVGFTHLINVREPPFVYPSLSAILAFCDFAIRHFRAAIKLLCIKLPMTF